MESTMTPVLSTEDDFFAKTKADLSYVNSQQLSFTPSSVITDHRLSFEIPKLTGSNCLFLNDLLVLLKLKIVDHEGKKPPDNAKVAPINLFPTTMFREARLILNETEVSVSENGGYALQAYSDVELNYAPNEKYGALSVYGYAPDVQGSFQDGDFGGIAFEKRRSFFSHVAGDKVVYNDTGTDFFSRVYSDLNTTSLPLVSGVNVRIELLLNDPRFYMQVRDANADTKRYRLKIESAVLQTVMRTMNPALYLDLEKRMLDSPLRYPLKRTEMKKINIPSNLSSFTTSALTQSSINPDRVVVMLVNETYWEGGYKANPLELGWSFSGGGKTSKLQRMSLTLNGAPVQPTQSDSPEQFVMGAFNRMNRNLGCLFRGNFSNGLLLEEFKGGFLFNLFDLAQDARSYDGGVRHKSKEGHLQLDLGFSQALPCSLVMFVLNEYHASVQIDKNRNITYDFLA